MLRQIERSPASHEVVLFCFVLLFFVFVLKKVYIYSVYA